MMYAQAAFALDAAPPHVPPSIERSASERPQTQAHTLTPSNRRLPEDLWGEYRIECMTRETLQLPPVSLTEFADMRDWSDSIEEAENDDAWITAPDTPPYAPFVAR